MVTTTLISVITSVVINFYLKVKEEIRVNYDRLHLQCANTLWYVLTICPNCLSIVPM